MKILLTYKYDDDKLNKIKELGYDIVYRHENIVFNQEDIDDSDILICYNPFKNLDISKMNNLKLILLSSIGIDQVPIDKVGKDVLVCNNKGGYSVAMGEWIVCKILEIYKDSKYFYEKKKEKKWKINTSLEEITDKTIGFLGTGTIANEAAKRLKSFDCEILGISKSGKQKEYFDEVYNIECLDEFLKKSDVVISCLPSTKETKYILNYSNLSLMKENSIFINISRGDIVKECDLIKLLKENKFKAVALDVFEKEPLDKECELWNFENVYISFHNSWISQLRNERRFNLIYKNLKRFKEKNDLLNVVNLKKGY